jgi:hypothetical protein
MKNHVVLSPVGKHRAIASISDELFGELGYLRIEVVHDIVNQTSSMGSFCGIPMLRIGSDAILRLETVHVDMTILCQFICELRSQLFMKRFWDVSEGVSDSLLLLLLIESRSTHGSMRHSGRSWLQFRERVERKRSGEILLEYCDDLSFFLHMIF